MKEIPTYLQHFFLFIINMQAKGEMFIFLNEDWSIRHILNVFLPSISVEFSEMFLIKMEILRLLDT